MTEKSLYALRFPVGDFVATPEPSAVQRRQCLHTMTKFPECLRRAIIVHAYSYA